MKINTDKEKEDILITNDELITGLTVDGVQILPKTTYETLNQLRTKRKIPYENLYGKIYYQMSELIEWKKKKKVKVKVA